MKKEPSAKKGGSGKTSTKKVSKLSGDNQSILQTSSVRKKDVETLKKADKK